MKFLETDLAVIGAGASGLSAGLEALEAGVARVTVLEKRPYAGGNAAMAGGTLYGAGTRLQQEAGNPATCREAVDDILAHHRYEGVDVPLVTALTGGTAAMMERVEQLGGSYRAQPRGNVHAPTAPSLDFGHFRALTQAMAERVCALGGTLLTQCAIEDITRSETGVFILKGQDFTVHARAVALCTGGFLGNKTMMDRYFPHLAHAPLSSDAIPLTGDGADLVRKLGGSLSERCTINMHGMNSFDRCFRYPNRLGQESPLWVNRLGQRFVAEEHSRISKNDLGNAVYAQPGQLCYALFDQTRLNEIAGGKFTTPQLRKTDVTRIFRVLAEEYKRRKWVCISDDWSDIARWMGADPAVLESTIETYNRSCGEGADHTMGKEAQFLTPLTTGPFIALKCVPVTIETYGPVKIDAGFHVLDENHSPISGLFAAGAITSGWQGADYYPRGSSLSFSLTGGMLCGQSAAEYLRDKY